MKNMKGYVLVWAFPPVRKKKTGHWRCEPGSVAMDTERGINSLYHLLTLDLEYIVHVFIIVPRPWHPTRSDEISK